MDRHEKAPEVLVMLDDIPEELLGPFRHLESLATSGVDPKTAKARNPEP